MNDYSEFDAATGRLTGKQCRAAAAPSASNGRAWVTGRYHHASWCVNPQTGAVERNTVGPTFHERKAQCRLQVLYRMHDHADTQRRHLREVVIALATGQPVPAAALAALQQIDAHAEALRHQLDAIEAAADMAALDAIQP